MAKYTWMALDDVAKQIYFYERIIAACDPYLLAAGEQVTDSCSLDDGIQDNSG